MTSQFLSDLSSIATVIEGFGSIGILVFTFYQVRCMKNELKQANIQTCFNIELEIYESRRQFQDTSNEVLEWSNEIKNLSNKENYKDKTRALSLKLNAAKEAYFSEIDRLCSYIIRRRLDEKDFRDDWAPLIGELVRQYNEEIINKYKHIFDLYIKWNISV